MYKKIGFLFLLSVLLVVSKAQSCEDIDILVKSIKDFHFNPPKFNEQQATKVINSAIQSLDPYHFIFLQKDLDELQRFKDDFFSEETFCKFNERLIDIYKIGFQTAKNNFAEFKIEKYPLQKEEKILFRDDEDSYFRSESERKKYWDSWFVYKYNRSKFQLLELKDTWSEEDIEKAFRERVSCFFSSMPSEDIALKSYVINASLDAIMNTCDAHSNYFNDEVKEEFDQDLSKEILSFGFTVYENDLGELHIDEIFHNGQAWLDGRLKEDLHILSIQFNNEEEDLLICIDEEEINSRLMKQDVVRVNLKFKDEEDNLVSSSLSKSKLQNEDNFMRGFLLEGITKVAYIAIPSFYYNEESGFGCATDLAKELILLKKEGIEGLIIDLRFNGGGSIQEAIDLAGIFINEGPLLIDSTTASPKASILKDPNRGLIYNGDLLVLYNGFSASASEMFASILRSYNRAVLVGSTSYGKATGQIFLPIEKNGFIKITTSQYCSLDGFSYQKNGVVPDILLPEEYEPFLFQEKEEKFAIGPIEVAKKVYFTPYKELPLDLLKLASEERLKTNKIFKELGKQNKEMKLAIEERDAVPLEYQNFILHQKKYEGLYEVYGNLKVDSSVFNLSFVNYQKELMEMDASIKNAYENEKNEILDDIYIQEAYQIINQLIQLKNEKTN